MNKIKVIVKQPGEDPKPKMVENTLEAFQKLVGGHIETVTLNDKLMLVVNEEGIINDMPFNCVAYGLHLFGPIVWVGRSSDGFCNVPIHESLAKCMCRR